MRLMIGFTHRTARDYAMRYHWTFEGSNFRDTEGQLVMYVRGYNKSDCEQILSIELPEEGGVIRGPFVVHPDFEKVLATRRRKE